VIYDSSEVVSKFLNLNSTMTFLSSPEWLLAEELPPDSPNQTYFFPPSETADSPCWKTRWLGQKQWHFYVYTKSYFCLYFSSKKLFRNNC